MQDAVTATADGHESVQRGRHDLAFLVTERVEMMHFEAMQPSAGAQCREVPLTRGADTPPVSQHLGLQCASATPRRRGAALPFPQLHGRPVQGFGVDRGEEVVGDVVGQRCRGSRQPAPQMLHDGWEVQQRHQGHGPPQREWWGFAWRSPARLTRACAHARGIPLSDDPGVRGLRACSPSTAHASAASRRDRRRPRQLGRSGPAPEPRCGP